MCSSQYICLATVERACFPVVADASDDLPIGCQCFHALDSIIEEDSQRCQLGLYPVFLDEGSLPMKLNCPFHHSQAPDDDVYSISLLPDEDDMSAQCGSKLAVLSLLEVQDPCEDQICFDAHASCEECIDFQKESLEAYSQCVIDIDIKKETVEESKPHMESHGNKNSDSLLANTPRVLQRQVSLKTGEKLAQLLMDHSAMFVKLPNKEKPVVEKFHDSSNNRWRRYKRAASFDSRKIVFLFSILSSFGTLVLIYLTLRVRQNSTGFEHSL
ncbi:uncharacterized protein LOC115683059 isoform X3 [Syzygium oleosum]|uniref:uncharacterized protein LOC115683059 isoform X3 n=1 Tax=Syzygium oleosum TaxID=219896 RepID=UPI0024BB7848|nr:uncharacterized protein LOC115683059 isoform X3 [Syzygium oleosum]